ncbi:SDR family NAD(P)-dependent oxidoreductase [Mucilaginibacter lappiensis]|uniref:NAD(P)-dependent dehydrogenase (Short-subunit alcohol dehydrogenase family) n=1 Tax=Mucilaginibacter lappiensis TaxID=354630 RepID=A0A1N7BRB8_9SPHI|nr:SDR family oxidoreductase [Mucilaginibacter lappiensis]MBB6110071.1 NAD(P)-dependent dehydrogenase (short-subunit alcohol dehydrogenase family) [Mucilaginibacter lappiensis]MBB6126779.1 NAD(P)-dependent dehydrogenase (short-subunit alcohol dehydrogenase family) [Mucilaginibacter lappiensis]SIR53850.1 NAD(P)-dependent dehydrogenase, short-chain alcohol dehydrogenase family [Mucilaginibacter lappiensis]
MLLKNKVIFLTGGTEGIGLECAKVYSAAGARLSIITNNEASIELAKAKLPKSEILFINADVSVAADMQQAITETVDHFGSLDVIHNNAGISNPSKAIHETTAEEWDKVFDINVKGIFNTTRFGIDELRKTKGNILNTSSLVGEIGQEIHAAYSATKGAVNALTKSMALDYAPYGIRVNAVAPAGVWTPMLRSWSQQQPDPLTIENYLDGIHALGYCPEGDVVADACLFLVSEQARFITGCILPVSGGAELGYRSVINPLNQLNQS